MGNLNRILVIGNKGCGKTFLIENLCATDDNVVVYRVVCGSSTHYETRIRDTKFEFIEERGFRLEHHDPHNDNAPLYIDDMYEDDGTPYVIPQRVKDNVPFADLVLICADGRLNDDIHVGLKLKSAFHAHFPQTKLRCVATVADKPHCDESKAFADMSISSKTGFGLDNVLRLFGPRDPPSLNLSAYNAVIKTHSRVHLWLYPTIHENYIERYRPLLARYQNYEWNWSLTHEWDFRDRLRWSNRLTGIFTH